MNFIRHAPFVLAYHYYLSYPISARSACDHFDSALPHKGKDLLCREEYKILQHVGSTHQLLIIYSITQRRPFMVWLESSLCIL